MPATFNYSPADVTLELLIQAGQLSRQSSTGQTSGSWPGFAAGEPDSPDETVTIFDTTGSWYSRDSITGEVAGPAGLQVRVRGSTHRIAYNKAALLYEYLSKQVYMRGVSIGTAPNGAYWIVESYVQFGDLLSIGKEAPNSRRSIVTFNIQVNLQDQTP